jgi:phospholipid transport system substrate-binding protein
MMDYEDLARQSLASHWKDLSDAEHKDFADTLRKLVQRSYEKNIKNIVDYSVEYLGEEPAEGRGLLVRTLASSKRSEGEEPVTIDYRMLQVGDAWRVIDIVTEGSSLVDNYKSQFNRIIQKDGFDALLKRMKDKLGKGQSP